MKRFFVCFCIFFLTMPSYNSYAQDYTISTHDQYYAIKNDNSLWAWDIQDDGQVINIRKVLEDVKAYNELINKPFWKLVTKQFPNIDKMDIVKAYMSYPESAYDIAEELGIVGNR